MNAVTRTQFDTPAKQFSESSSLSVTASAAALNTGPVLDGSPTAQAGQPISSHHRETDHDDRRQRDAAR